jgi:hypothetical protein
VVVAVLVIVGFNSKVSTAAAPRILLTDTQLQTLESVPLDSLVAASPRVTDLDSANSISGPALKGPDGKPEVLYIGAEFCPICATERWPLVIALAKFGTFHNVSQIRSAEREYNIGTLSLYHSTYTSPYLDLVTVEDETNIPTGPDTYKPLETPTAAENNLWQTIDSEAGESGETFPFIDLAGKTVLLTYQFSDSLLVEKSFDQIYNDVGNNSTTIGANIDAAAAAMTKYICGITNQQPSAVCSAVASVNAPISSASSSSGASSSAG